jgi:hypothetical protein
MQAKKLVAGVAVAVGLSVSGVASNVLDGENPPPGSLTDCGRDLFGFPIRC